MRGSIGAWGTPPPPLENSNLNLNSHYKIPKIVSPGQKKKYGSAHAVSCLINLSEVDCTIILTLPWCTFKKFDCNRVHSS